MSELQKLKQQQHPPQLLLLPLPHEGATPRSLPRKTVLWVQEKKTVLGVQEKKRQIFPNQLIKGTTVCFPTSDHVELPLRKQVQDALIDLKRNL